MPLVGPEGSWGTLAVPWASLGGLLGSLGGPFGVPWGSLGGRLGRLWGPWVSLGGPSGGLGKTLWSGSEPMSFQGRPRERRCGSEVVPRIAQSAKSSENAVRYVKIRGRAGCLRARFGHLWAGLGEPLASSRCPCGSLREPFGLLKVALGDPIRGLCAINAAVGSRRGGSDCERRRKPTETGSGQGSGTM